ncbi:hypothetical protein SAMN05421759_10990 [Roseivivax lentus]|uniref:Uncharacterized protein n=1 Tax=Roseivivax lentus TaxID=633194 RepID=A0A1N7NPI2_9RHOB|nr:hypothetical protein [Roseivivax lentus]SIT00226.1 hypothetical protein SAMN05421759_10990 [Roseivivax lentus]
MRIPAFTEDENFGKLTVVTKFEPPKEWAEAVEALADEVGRMQQEIVALRRYVAANRQAIRRLMDVYNEHWTLFRVAEIHSIRDLAQLKGNERRSALAKMNKSEHWPDEQARQLTPEEFKEICEAAKIVTEDDET